MNFTDGCGNVSYNAFLLQDLAVVKTYSPALLVIFCAANIVSAICSSSGNALVLITVWSFTELHISSNIALASLAAANFFEGLIIHCFCAFGVVSVIQEDCPFSRLSYVFSSSWPALSCTVPFLTSPTRRLIVTSLWSILFATKWFCLSNASLNSSLPSGRPACSSVFHFWLTIPSSMNDLKMPCQRSCLWRLLQYFISILEFIAFPEDNANNFTYNSKRCCNLLSQINSDIDLEAQKQCFLFSWLFLLVSSQL